jgi:hypothetical protein
VRTRIGLILTIAILGNFVFMQKADARVCRGAPQSWHSMIDAMGGWQTRQLQNVYRAEGLGCYVGDHGSSFGPFQFHYGGGMGDVFTRQTGLNARNSKTVPAQITFMRRWGSAHGGFSSSIWHGLRHRRGFHHWRH